MTTLPVSTQQVRDLYTRFPYPPVGVTAERGTPIPAILDYTRHIFWPGRSELAGLRVLDAGCGTGRTAVAIARDYPEVEVLGIDLSEASLDRARLLAHAANVGHNLQWKMLPIEEVGTLGQEFDYIIASGVIHHLASPEHGLRALTDVLAPTGGMFLMVYATYGRAGVYMLQDAIRLLGAGADYPELVAMTRPLLEHLPADHPFNALAWQDAIWKDDAGIVDLLLHVRDRSYTVPQLFALLDGAGLRLTRFADQVAYDPAMYVQQPELMERVAGLDARARAEVAELLGGRMRKHAAYVTRATYTPFQPTPTGLVLLALHPRRSPLFRWDELRVVGKKQRKQFRLTEGAGSEAHTREFDFAAWQLAVVSECDGIRTAMDVFNLPQVQRQIPGDNPDAKLQRFGELLEILAAGEVIWCES
ncbi:MAG TPA: methyltransferase [Chloroflexota bacterium]|nr:methyltransferase [Chloroflexota bacterium]